MYRRLPYDGQATPIVAEFPGGRRHDPPEPPDLVKQWTRGEAVGGSDRATGLAEGGGDPGVAGVKGGIGPASPIPAFPQTNRPAGLVEGVGLFDVLAQAGKAAGGKIDFDDRKLWVFEFRRGAC